MGEISCKIYRQGNYKTSKWEGGTTTQLAIYPESADYTQGDFLWCLNITQLETSESNFTSLPDYNRILLVLSGEVILAHEGERIARLSTLEQDRFDGAYNTKSYGETTDYNLMVRKGWEGLMEVLLPTEQSTALVPVDCAQHEDISLGFYCHEGYAAVTVNGEMHMLTQGSQLVVEAKGEPVEASYMGEGTLIYTFVHCRQDVGGPTIIPKEKGTALDFLTAVKISWTNLGGRQQEIKSIKGFWYDEELKRGIRKLERMLIPFWIGLIGLAVCGFGARELVGDGAIIPAILIWLLMDCLIVTPTLYFLVLPKPIKLHMKPMESLTEYEQRVYEEEKTNETGRADKILKKYKITGRNKYIN